MLCLLRSLHSFNALVYQGVDGKPCEEDFALVPEVCGGVILCSFAGGCCLFKVGFRWVHVVSQAQPCLPDLRAAADEEQLFFSGQPWYSS